MFYGLRSGAVRAHGLAFADVLRDIETLNRMASRGTLEVTALSLHGYAYVSRRYRLLPHGASVGDGYGPIVVSEKLPPGHDLAGVRVAVPGLRTTAYLALRLCHPNARPVVMRFDKILPACAAGRIPAGVIIHEGQLTYARAGVTRVTDLGAWWKKKTGTPLVLGVNAIRRDIPPARQRAVSRALHASIRYALLHRRPGGSGAGPPTVSSPCT